MNMYCKYCKKFLAQIPVKGHIHFCNPPANCRTIYYRQLATARKQRQRENTSKKKRHSTYVTQNSKKNVIKLDPYDGKKWGLRSIPCIDIKGHDWRADFSYRPIRITCPRCNFPIINEKTK